jgi:ABC-2 type transport system ATP-binding protein
VSSRPALTTHRHQFSPARRTRGAADVCSALSWTLSVSQVTYMAAIKGVGEPAAAATSTLEELGLTPAAARKGKELSAQQARMLCVATAVVGDPHVLLLDAPTVTMDAPHQQLVWALLRR